MTVFLCFWSPKVEISIQSNFQPGMKLEVANKNDPDTYWVATVITTCGQLLLLRYCGCGEDRRADFWCDVVTADLHPVGWCTQNNKALTPPDGRFSLPPARSPCLAGRLHSRCLQGILVCDPAADSAGRPGAVDGLRVSLA